MKSAQFSKLPVSFHFASFAWPRYLAALPKGPLPKRLADAKTRCCGQYQLTGVAIANRADCQRSFYHESDFAPGLRWTYADKVDGARINHSGWWADEYHDTKIRGVVFRLPHGRGFLAGWTMGRNMASGIEYDCTYETEPEAAYAANDIAEVVAEKEREYQEREQAKLDTEESE